MILLPPGAKVHLVYGYTDMRKGIDGLALLVQEVLQHDPFSGHLFVLWGAARPTSSRSCSGTGRACARPPSGSHIASSSAPIARGAASGSLPTGGYEQGIAE